MPFCIFSWCRVSDCSAKVDVVFAVDMSGSIGEDYENMIDFTKQTIRRLPVNADATHLSVITFRDNATILFDLDDYQTPSSIRNALVFGRSGGETNIYQAIALARQSAFTLNRGDRPDARNFLVLVTDGIATVQAEKVSAELVAAKEARIDVLAVLLGKESDVRNLTIDPMFVRNSNDVNPVSVDIVNRLCTTA